MKFAIINDMHVGPLSSGRYNGVQRKLVADAERLVKEFVDRMNNQEHPEFVVNLGDSIEDVNNRDTDIKSFEKSVALLSKLGMPTYSLIGNHDIRTITQEEISKMFGYEHMYYSFERGNYHFVALGFERDMDKKSPNYLMTFMPDGQLDWLKNDLGATKKPTIIFTHYGLAEDDMKGNFWFENAPDKALLANREQLREILEESGKVRAVISAHQHWNRMFIHNGIPYFTVTSLVENFNNDGVPSEAHTVVTLEKYKIVVNVKGNDQAKFEFSW